MLTRTPNPPTLIYPYPSIPITNAVFAGKFVFESLGGEFGGGKCGARRMLPDDKGVAGACVRSLVWVCGWNGLVV